MSDTSRKWTGRAIQVALVIVALALVGNWIWSKIHRSAERMYVKTVATIPDTLGPGDMRIYNTDSTVDLVLIGDRIAAGLSPKMIAKVRHDMDSSKTGDSGLGGAIAGIVKSSVAGAIGTHAEFALADLKDIRYDQGKLILDWKKGKDYVLFQNTHVNGNTSSDTFREADAKAFIAAVQARRKELGLIP